MSDKTVLLLTVLFELGLPLILLVVTLFSAKARSWTVVVLGSLTPFILLYAITAVGVFFFKSDDATWTFNGMWSMSLIPYAACMVLGLAIGMLKAPQSKSTRYIVGLVPAALLGLVVSQIIN